jgi:predicted metal-dependent hydrolase
VITAHGALHLCFAEHPQEFMDLVNTFLDQRDAAG